MKKKVLIVLTILFLLAMICLLFYYNYAKKNLMLLPEGELQSTFISPNGKKKLNIYLVDGGSLSANATSSNSGTVVRLPVVVIIVHMLSLLISLRT